MSSKTELHRKLKEIGYEIGPFASKDTLSIVLRLHLLAANTKGIDVSKLNDLDLRKSLIENNVVVGPVTGHTRAIYQRKLLEKLTNETTEGREDDGDSSEEASSPKSTLSSSPPRPASSLSSSLLHASSGARAGDVSTTSRSPPLRSTTGAIGSDLVFSEPRIQLTRIELPPSIQLTTQSPATTAGITPKHASTPSASPAHSFPSSTTVPPKRYSPGISDDAEEAKRFSSSSSSGLRNPYDFQQTEPPRPYEHSATPFATAKRAPVAFEPKGSGEPLFYEQSRYVRRQEEQHSPARHSVLGTGSSSSSSTYGETSRHEDINKVTQRKPFSSMSASMNDGLSFGEPKASYTSATTTTRHSPPKKVVFADNNDTLLDKKNQESDKNVPVTDNSNLIYYGITAVVALLVFVLYLWLGN